MAGALAPSSKPNYVYDASGAISVNVNDGYWDQTFGGEANQEKEKELKLPNAVFFGPLQGVANTA